MTRLNASLCFLIAGLACVAALPYLPPPVFLGGLLLALLLLLWLYIRSKTRPAFLLLVMALLLGSWRGLDYGRQLGIQRLPEQLAGADLLIQGTIINLPEHTESGERFDLVLGHIVQAPASLPTAMLEAWQPGKLRLTAFHNPGTQDNWSELQPGQRWQLHVRLRPPRSTLNPACALSG